VYLKLTADKVEIMNIPDPAEVADAMTRAILRRRRDGPELPLPRVTTEIPADIRLLAQGEMRGLPTFDGAPGVAARARIAFVASVDYEHKP
jgi:hypothetical protein